MPTVGAQALGARWSFPEDVMSRLLIVDDEPEYLDELVEALAFGGIESTSVRSAAAAIEAVKTDPEIAIVLTDLRMPDMDGVSLIINLKKTFPARNLAFVVMTGHAAEADMASAMAAGAVRCFPKPLAFDALQTTIEKLEGAPA